MRLLKYILLLIPFLAFGQPEAKWLFDNNGIDSSGNGHTVVLSGGASYSSTVKQQGTHSALFEYGDIAKMTSALNVGDTFTISANFYLNLYNSSYRVICTNKQNSGDQGFMIYYDATAQRIKVMTTSSTLAHYTYTLPAVVLLNQWNHIAVTFKKGAFVKVIYNAAVYSSSTIIAPNFDTSDTISWGSMRTVSIGGALQGYIDKGEIWTCLLSDTKIIDSVYANRSNSKSVLCGDVTTIPVTSVSIPSTLTLSLSQISTLTETVLPTNASNKSVSWVSTDPGIATVTGGLVSGAYVKGISAGTCKVIVTSNSGNKKDTCDVTVNGYVVARKDTIKVNFCNLSTVQTTGNWNNISSTTLGETYSLVNYRGNATGVNLRIASDNITNSVLSGMTTSFCPVNCANSFFGTTSGTGMIRFSNLVVGQEYKMRIYAGRATSEIRNTGFCIAGYADTVTVSNNQNTIVEFTYLSTGTDTLYFWNTNLLYSYLNALELITVADYPKRTHYASPTNYTYRYNNKTYMADLTDIFNDYIDTTVIPDPTPDPDPDPNDITPSDLNYYFAQDFESIPTGAYDDATFRSAFPNPNYWSGNWAFTTYTSGQQDLSNPINNTKVVQFRYPQNSVSCCTEQFGHPVGGTVAYKPLDNFAERDELYMSQDLMLMPGFKAGTVLGGGGKLLSFMAGPREPLPGSGLVVGEDASSPALMFGTDNTNAGVANIQLYFYWPDNPENQVEGYGVTINCGLPMSAYFPGGINWMHLVNGSTPVGGYHTNLTSAYVEYTSGIPANISTGVWHNITYRVVMNTVSVEGVGEYNGLLELWYDGVLTIRVAGIKWRTVSTLKLGTARICTFFGGQATSPTDNSRVSPIDQWMRVDNIEIFDYKTSVDVPRGLTKSPNDRTMPEHR